MEPQEGGRWGDVEVEEGNFELLFKDCIDRTNLLQKGLSISFKKGFLNI